MIGFMKSNKYFMEIYIKRINDFIVICQLPNLEHEFIGNKNILRIKNLNYTSNFEMQKLIRHILYIVSSRTS